MIKEIEEKLRKKEEEEEERRTRLLHLETSHQSVRFRFSIQGKGREWVLNMVNEHERVVRGPFPSELCEFYVIDE